VRVESGRGESRVDVALAYVRRAMVHALTNSSLVLIVS
jgi:hypothetical protein